MNTLTNSASTVPAALHPPLDKFLLAIGSRARWRILAELGAGEPLMVKELAGWLKYSPSLVSKHLAVLREAGMVMVGHAGVYLIPPHFAMNTAERHVDFGHCLLRLPGKI
jgi:DNA-binding HxlR family transcriptional regulator